MTGDEYNVYFVTGGEYKVYFVTGGEYNVYFVTGGEYNVYFVTGGEYNVYFVTGGEYNVYFVTGGEYKASPPLCLERGITYTITLTILPKARSALESDTVVFVDSVSFVVLYNSNC